MMFELLFLASEVGVVGSILAYRFGRARLRTRRHAAAAAAGQPLLSAWATMREFQLGDPADLETAAQIQQALGLAAEEGDRQIGIILQGRAATGSVQLLDSWRRDGQGPHAATCLVTTEAVIRPATLTVEKIGVTGGEGAAAEALVGLPVGTRLQLAPGRFALHVPLPLTPELASDLLARVTVLDARLDRVPGSHRVGQALGATR